MSAEPLPIDEAAYERGLELIRGGEYFAAHEVLEDVWRAAAAGERDFFQGLVHVAVAWYQAGRANRVGCERQLEKAARRLSPYRPLHRGLDVATLVAQLRLAARAYPALPLPALLPARDALGRALAFLRWAENAGAEEAAPFRLGTVFRNEALGRVWDLNFLRVEALPANADATVLAGEADRVQGAAGLAHRKVHVEEPEEAARLAPGFRELGWEVVRHLVMAQTRPPERPLDAGRAREVEEAELQAARARFERALRPGDEETALQLAAMMARLAEAPYLRRFAVEADGEVAAWCELYSDGRTAQLEDVVTLAEHRGRGLARQVVSRALLEARAAGHDFVFLVADADDWPKDFYARLGFDALGVKHLFLRKPS